jgi:uncharacterized Ntn-hydrolase superfamily protein
MYLSTFSISARCARSGMLGVAVSTAVPGVGGICPFVRPGIGAVSTQAWVNPYLGVDAIAPLSRGKSAEETLGEVIEADPGRAVRQLGVVDAEGRSCAWTGEDCVVWAGQKTGPDVSVQGNMLVGPETIEAMFESFAASADESLPERLVKVLEAGQAAGGDKRGKQSAAMLVYDKEDYPHIDLRVDEHSAPVGELRRVFEVAKEQYLPFVVGMPTRENPLGALPDDVVEMLLRAPADRPGGTLSRG